MRWHHRDRVPRTAAVSQHAAQIELHVERRPVHQILQTRDGVLLQVRAYSGTVDRDVDAEIAQMCARADPESIKIFASRSSPRR